MRPSVPLTLCRIVDGQYGFWWTLTIRNVIRKVEGAFSLANPIINEEKLPFAIRKVIIHKILSKLLTCYDGTVSMATNFGFGGNWCKFCHFGVYRTGILRLKPTNTRWQRVPQLLRGRMGRLINHSQVFTKAVSLNLLKVQGSVVWFPLRVDPDTRLLLLSACEPDHWRWCHLNSPGRNT